jgi:hypothetical protein
MLVVGNPPIRPMKATSSPCLRISSMSFLVKSMGYPITITRLLTKRKRMWKDWSRA